MFYRTEKIYVYIYVFVLTVLRVIRRAHIDRSRHVYKTIACVSPCPVCFCFVFPLFFFFFPTNQELAQVKTPPNVKMIDTSPAHLAWLLAGVVYPPNADEHPDLYVNDFILASSETLTPRQMKPRNARLKAAKFIQKLLSKVRYDVLEIRGWPGGVGFLAHGGNIELII